MLGQEVMTIDVEKEFAKCVRAIGGIVLDDQLNNPSFPNADYWFPKNRVVCELKRLSENLSEKEAFKKEISDLYRTWVLKKIVPPAPSDVFRINTNDMPEECAYQFIEIIKKRIEFSTIKKANRQIKKTKEFLNEGDAKGLLLLLNDGNLIMNPDLVIHLLRRILNKKYTSISSIIYFSVNPKVSFPGVDMPTSFWIDAILPDRVPVDKTFRDELQNIWFAHHSKLIQGPIHEILMPNDPSILERIKFTK
jgi:hypothetical protein